MRAAEFVALATWLRGADPPPEPEVPSVPAGEPEIDEAIATCAASPDVVDAVRDARRFRARLADAFDDAVQRVLQELASDILARELRLAPCALDAVIRRAAGTLPIVRVRVAPQDVACVDGLPVIGDPALEPGDAVIEVAGGTLDARLGVRLAAVLESVP